jgi:hypothetical protein
MTPKDRNEALNRLARSFNVREQLDLRDAVERDEAYYRDIFQTYLRNPFLRLTDEELEAVSRVTPPALGKLMAAREVASRSLTPKYVVFCMPKSGSSFVEAALEHALELPKVSLTSFGAGDLSSWFGMNGREQELDGLAMVRSVLSSPAGFVAQHHTRYTFYLALQLRMFRITPVITVRNIFDCIVSFDDMMLQWRRAARKPQWMSDAQFALPEDYQDLPAERRYWLLAHSFGVWLVNFYLSWKRGRAQTRADWALIRYEDHVLDPDRLVETLAAHLRMTPGQRDRLAEYAHRPDPSRARLNVGRRGRGAEQIPEPIRAFLTDYARAFAAELDAEDIGYLVG